MPVLSIFSDYSKYSTKFFHSDHVNAKEPLVLAFWILSISYDFISFLPL